METALVKKIKTHGWLGNLRFFVQILCWAPWISQVQSTGRPCALLQATTLQFVLEHSRELDLYFDPFKVIEEKIKTSGRVKQIVEIPMEFRGSTDTRRGGRGGRGRGDRGGRGGRGRGRGGFGSRADSDKSGDNFALNAEEFPTLG